MGNQIDSEKDDENVALNDAMDISTVEENDNLNNLNERQTDLEVVDARPKKGTKNCVFWLLLSFFDFNNSLMF